MKSKTTLMSTALAHALISRSNSSSTIHWLQSVPTPLEEKNLGTLFGILEIESTDSKNDDLLNVIGEEIHAAFYSSEHFSSEAAFEVALQKTNKKIQALSRSTGDEWLRQFNAIVGVIVGDQLYFSHVGSAVALLLFKGKLTELLDHTKAKTEIINPVKVFQDTIAGEIQGNSALFFSTETIYDYFSQEKIRRLLIDYSPEDAAEQLSRSLDNAAHTSLGCAILAPKHVESQAQSLQSQRVANDEHVVQVQQPLSIDTAMEEDAPIESDSMSRLLNKEHQTSQTLSGSLWSTVKASLQKNTTQSSDKHPAIIVLSKILSTSARLAGFIWQSLRSGITLIAEKRKRSSLSGYSPRLSAQRGSTSAQFISRMKKILSGAWQWFLQLTMIQKSCIVVAVLVCVIVLSGMFNQGHTQISKEKEEQYATALSQADTKINEAKAALLYDKNRARTLLNEAKTLVESVPENADDFHQGVEDRSKEIAKQLLIANGVKVIENPETVLQFSSLASSVAVSRMSLLGASIYAFDASGGRVYRGNLDTKQSTVVIDQSSNTVLASSQASLGTALVVLSNQTLGILKPVSESIESINTTFPQSEVNLVDARIFANKLYTIDTKNNQIYKHVKNTDLNFAQGSAWITDGTSVSSAVSFAIDGSIYVLSNSGSVIKMSGGKKESWSLASVDPALQNANKIVTDENTSKLYILDSSSSRILIFAKDGSLDAQYQSSIFAQAKDLLVDESKKTMYVLSNNTVYTISVE